MHRIFLELRSIFHPRTSRPQPVLGCAVRHFSLQMWYLNLFLLILVKYFVQWLNMSILLDWRSVVFWWWKGYFILRGVLRCKWKLTLFNALLVRVCFYRWFAWVFTGAEHLTAATTDVFSFAAWGWTPRKLELYLRLLSIDVWIASLSWWLKLDLFLFSAIYIASTLYTLVLWTCWGLGWCSTMAVSTYRLRTPIARDIV